MFQISLDDLSFQFLCNISHSRGGNEIFSTNGLAISTNEKEANEYVGYH